jgi:hypothetical protein
MKLDSSRKEMMWQLQKRQETQCRARRCQDDLGTKLGNSMKWKLSSEILLLKNWYMHTCIIYLLFIHKENLKYLNMAITTIIRKHNMPIIVTPFHMNVQG